MNLHYSEHAARRGRATKITSHRAVLAGFAFLAALVNLVPAAAQSPVADAPPQCTPATLSVALTEGGPQSSTVVGELCLPPHGSATAVHVTIHGATYDHTYWNWPFKPSIYSYAKALTTAGYAVFDYDRIGDGQSSHPPSTEISIASNAFVAHQVVQALRSGHIGGTAFQRVVLVGHSVGSFTSWQEAGQYHDVDGVILTAIAHSYNPTGLQLALSDVYPAIDDPRFSNSGLDGGYLTTIPGTRGALFYDVATADPTVIALDEATKQTTTVTELEGTLASGPGSPLSFASSIDVPVLLIDGQKDLLFCTAQGSQGGADCTSAATLAASESPFYSPKACLRTAVIPGTAHDVNLHPTALLTYVIAALWSDTFVGRDAPAPACKPGN
jgi:pimeloyl-ACP methyl ester carboxylesterase